jgi:hypothetical protein
MHRVTAVPTTGVFESRVVVTLRDGEQLDATANRAHGNPADPLSDEERLEKFHECAAALASEGQRDRIVELVGRLDALADVRELAFTLGAPG